jgi:hypothetical protein
MSASGGKDVSRSGIRRTAGRFGRAVSGSAALQSTRRFFYRHIWVRPLLAAFVLGLAGWWANDAVDGAMRQQRQNELMTVHEADVTALRTWMGEQEVNAQLLANDERLLGPVRELLALAEAKETTKRQLVQAKAQTELQARLTPRLKIAGYDGFYVVSPAAVIVAADQDAPIGKPLMTERKEFFERIMAGQPSVSKPYRSPLLLADARGELRANLPTMLAAALIRDETGKPVAALGVRIRPDDHFTRILQVARIGKSGETFAFDRNGLLLSQSRFDDDLKQIGLLADTPDTQSILTVELRDPGANMMKGARPALRRTDQPLTRIAADAAAGSSGIDVEGHNDYRGVPVIGAWTWLPEYDLGVATEVDVAESFRPLYILRKVFGVLIALLILGGVGTFIYMLVVARQHRALQKAVLEARQLGQYTLEEKLGSGGMGTVYRARHAMLRRPTAVKLLEPEKVSDAAVLRFEREVQLTSGLTHPNTIAIYDYGRTPEGIFYYAMEYLEGKNLEDLVQRHGPLPEGRVIYLLRQACGSLAEAHAIGLIHRDVKPANIFLTRRGGLHDFVKVLDFGLVKAVGTPREAGITSPNAVSGTPLYLSPEAIHRPDAIDARSDVYALGAVGYYLLTGTPVFSGTNVLEICMKHAHTPPEPPSARLGKPVSSALEQLLLRCLAKEREQRPANAEALLRELEGCAVADVWTADVAAVWWRERSATAAAKTSTDIQRGPGELPQTVLFEGPAQVPAAADNIHQEGPS